MLIGIVAALMLAQGPPVVRTAGPPVSLNPQNAAVAPQQPGDGAVLGVIGAFDANRIEAAKLGKEKGSSSDVKTFADLVLRERQACLTSGAELAKQFNITRLLPPDSASARLHEREMTQLSVLTGSAFDKAFMQYMRDDYQALATKLNGSLGTQATRPQVKTFVKELLPKLVTHQETAQKWLTAHP